MRFPEIDPSETRVGITKNNFSAKNPSVHQGLRAMTGNVAQTLGFPERHLLHPSVHQGFKLCSKCKTYNIK